MDWVGASATVDSTAAVRFLPLGGVTGAQVDILGMALGALELAEEPSVVLGDSSGCLREPTVFATTRRGAEFSMDQPINTRDADLYLLAPLRNFILLPLQPLQRHRPCQVR